jgi:transcriptional regulator with XRE-family HTH domain
VSEPVEALLTLGADLRRTRAARGLSLRDASAECGVSFNSLSRIERGKDTTLSTAVAVLRWIGRER